MRATCLILLPSVVLSSVHVFTGFEKPSAVQQRSIIPIVKGEMKLPHRRQTHTQAIMNCYSRFGVVSGRDVIAQSQSGTGKTAVFSIASLQSIDMSTTDTQVLILSPTRELAEQSQKVILALGDYMR